MFDSIARMAMCRVKHCISDRQRRGALQIKALLLSLLLLVSVWSLLFVVVLVFLAEKNLVVAVFVVHLRVSL